MDENVAKPTDGSSAGGNQQVNPSAEVEQAPSPEKQGAEGTPIYTEVQLKQKISERHSTLDKRLAAQDKVIGDLQKSLAERRTAEVARAELKLNADEEAALREAGDDEETRNKVKAQFAELRQGRGLQAENTQLKEQLKTYARAEELLEQLNVETPEELLQLLEQAIKTGQANEVKRLSETYSVAEKLITPLLRLASTPEELENLVKDLSDAFPAGAKLPAPAVPGKVAGGEKSYAQGLKERYPSMNK